MARDSEGTRREYSEVSRALQQIEHSRKELLYEIRRKELALEEERGRCAALRRDLDTTRIQLRDTAKAKDQQWRQAAGLDVALRDARRKDEELQEDLRRARMEVPSIHWREQRLRTGPASVADAVRIESRSDVFEQKLRRAMAGIAASDEAGPAVWKAWPIVDVSQLDLSWPLAILEVSWAVTFCLVLDALTDGMEHWLIFTASHVLSLAFAVLHCWHIAFWRKQAGLGGESSASDEETERLLGGSRQRSSNAAWGTANDCGEWVNIENLIAPIDKALHAQRYALLPSICLAFQHIVYMGFFARAFPSGCAWATLRSPDTSRVSRDGYVTCADARRLGSGSALADPLEAAEWLTIVLPIAWSSVWLCITRAGFLSCAQILLDVVRQGEEALFPMAFGHPSSELAERLQEQFLVLAEDLGHRWQDTRRATLSMVIDVLDCVDLWRTFAVTPELFFAGPRDEVLSDGQPIWWFRLVGLILALGALACSVLVAFSSVFGQGSAFGRHTSGSGKPSVRVCLAQESELTLALLFARGELEMPTRNTRLAFHAGLSMLLIDAPFLAFRIAMAWLLLNLPSPLVVKEAVCLCCRARFVWRYFRWTRAVSEWREEHIDSLVDLDSLICEPKGVRPERGLDVHIEEACNVLAESVAEFVALYREDVGSVWDSPPAAGAPL